MGHLLVLSVFLLVTSTTQKDVKTTKDPFLMPGVEPKVKDTYLCYARKMNATNPLYILGYEPKPDKHVGHHMLLYGCKTPGFTDRVWNCGEMESDGSQSDFDEASTCCSGPTILYAWAHDATSLSLPKDVAFKVGGETDVKYLVLQVHYKMAPPPDHKDTSGINLITTRTALPKRAGVYLMGTSGVISARSTVYMETACPIKDNIVMHPFAYRAHTHHHGKVVAGYRIRNGMWTELGRVSPQLPQMFYNVTTPNLDITTDDILAARCTMKNDGNDDVQIGSTQNDEMCNFYLMYWVDNGHLLHETYCFSDGPPMGSWDTSYLARYMNLDAAPTDISTQPDTGETFAQDIGDTDLLQDILDSYRSEEEEYAPRRYRYFDGDY